MINGKKIIGIIPARGGSKRFPRKNISLLAGKPLLAWTVEAGLNSRFIDKVVVSTDDDEIAAVAAEFGADVPFRRPVELATDTASSFAVIDHIIGYYHNQLGTDFELTVLLQPTSPLRNSTDIDQALEYLEMKNADSVISGCEMEHSPLWCNILPDNLSMKNFIREDVKGLRSQDMPQFYRLNGAIYICKTAVLLKERTFFLNNNVFAYIMPLEKSFDIDKEIDLKFCEFYMSNILSN